MVMMLLHSSGLSRLYKLPRPGIVSQTAGRFPNPVPISSRKKQLCRQTSSSNRNDAGKY